jgi:hypothetical protein
MVGPPRFHEELGANGVEVTIWNERKGECQEGSELKTWPATTRSVRSGFGDKPEQRAAFRSAGVGQPFPGNLKYEI